LLSVQLSKNPPSCILIWPIQLHMDIFWVSLIIYKLIYSPALHCFSDLEEFQFLMVIYCSRSSFRCQVSACYAIARDFAS
uniref:Uncharacterized protein n=1 Tax=Aegilops tauschii subsp. strangulata TaxID=200361 RepID=A0A452XKK3_AEGTS